ncbi:isocitrate/isopropylmalate family dehydrogenase [Staphylococcus aureus]
MTAPDIAGKNVANPFGMILILVMCLRESLNQPDAADELENIYKIIIETWYSL